MSIARKSLALIMALTLTSVLPGALLQQKPVDGYPSKVSKNVLTLVTNVGTGAYSEFEVGKDVPILIDGHPGELAELETCFRAKVEVDGKTVKKITAEFMKPTDLSGTLKEIDLKAGTLTIYAYWDDVAKEPKDLTLKVTPDTKVYYKGKPAKLSDIKPRVNQGTIRHKLRETVEILRVVPMKQP